MSEERKYIYSIIRNPEETQSPHQSKSRWNRGSSTESGHGTGQASDNFRLSEAVFGINNREIIFIPYRDIAAAVSSTHLVNFDKLDKKEFTHLVAMHEQVNARLLEKHDVIPMRFGMIAENTGEICSILAKAYLQFKTTLERVAGKAEFIVQVFWNEKNALEKIARESNEIQKLKKEVESRGKILGFSSKMKLGKAIFEALGSRRKEYIKDILDNLAARFPDFSAGKLMDTVKTEDKEMIMNYSFLIGKGGSEAGALLPPKTEESALEFGLNQLAEKYKDELKFKYIGPMAPYSFTVINLSVGNFDLVDGARKVLGFGESAALPEIKEAYHKLAAEYHPDKHEYKDDQVILEEAIKKMKDIAAANEVLTVYCRHYLSALPPEKEQVCSFKKEDVENSIIIKKSSQYESAI